jgi:translocator protein
MKPWVLVAFLIVCFVAAGLGGLLTNPGLPWLATLQKPRLNPPDWVFGPVWTTLYTLMAISGWLVFRAQPSTSRTTALTLFAVQLVLNVAWSAIFFFLRQPGLALIEIVVLWGTIWSYAFFASRASHVASKLFVPYGLWVTFALYLNAGLWFLNRS